MLASFVPHSELYITVPYNPSRGHWSLCKRRSWVASIFTPALPLASDLSIRCLIQLETWAQGQQEAKPQPSLHCGPGQWQPRVLTSVPCISHRTCTACWGLWVTAGNSYGNPSDAVGSPLFCIWWEPPRWSLLRCLLRSASLALSWGARNKKGQGRPAGPWGPWLTVTVKFQTRGMRQVLKLNQSC